MGRIRVGARMTLSWIEKVQDGVLNYVLKVAECIVAGARSRRVSVRVRSLVRYGYAAYVFGTLDFRRIRGLVSRVEPPSYIANRHFYGRVEEVLARRFDVRFEDRRGFRYAVFNREKVVFARVV
ncbi:MAG: hypothetical protein DRJ37_03030 [Thermoprotei archaeon]|nr:MAG: hypothetical protein DRJ37_03030 [Thermoprotei archaeon]